jgi:lysophospholipase L1-like esterase
VLAASLLAAALAAEVVLRGFIDLPLVRIEPEVRYDPHPSRRFTLRPSQDAYTYGARASVGSDGFRVSGAAAVGEATQAPLIVALGDSFTFGLGVEDQETWPARLEAELEQALGSDIRVLNAGTISYGVFQEMDLLLERALSEQPVVVVHALYWNDFMNAAPPRPLDPPAVTEDGYFTWDGIGGRGFRAWISEISNRSALLFASKSVIRRILSGAPEATTDYGREYDRLLSSGLAEQDWDILRAFYRDLKDLGKERAFVPFAVILPVIDLVDGIEAANLYRQGATQILREAGVPFVDAFAVWDEQALGEEQFLPQGRDAHLNAEGYRRLSAAIAAGLLSERDVVAQLGVAASSSPDE